MRVQTLCVCVLCTFCFPVYCFVFLHKHCETFLLHSVFFARIIVRFHSCRVLRCILRTNISISRLLAVDRFFFRDTQILLTIVFYSNFRSLCAIFGHTLCSHLCYKVVILLSLFADGLLFQCVSICDFPSNLFLSTLCSMYLDQHHTLPCTLPSTIFSPSSIFLTIFIRITYSCQPWHLIYFPHCKAIDLADYLKQMDAFECFRKLLIAITQNSFFNLKTIIDSFFIYLTNNQIPATTTRILLNHFKWDKEKLMERYYDGDQEAFFRNAHVINPFKKPPIVAKLRMKRSGTEECEICYSNFPPSVSFHLF